MEIAIVALAVACAIGALAFTAIAATVPFLAWRLLVVERQLTEQQRVLDSKVDKLDDAMATILEAAGVPK